MQREMNQMNEEFNIQCYLFPVRRTGFETRRVDRKHKGTREPGSRMHLSRPLGH